MINSPFQDKVFVITGAASGIGRALATTLAGMGALLSLADVNEAALTRVRAELVDLQLQQSSGGQAESDQPKSNPTTTILTKVVDVRSQSACNEWISATVSHFGRAISGAANLAGVIGTSVAQERGAIRSITDNEFDWVMDINVKGTLNCLRAELPHMQVGRNGRDGGSIVNASSVSGICGLEYNGPYVAAKHAVVGMTRTVAKEEGQKAIRANAIAP